MTAHSASFAWFALLVLPAWGAAPQSQGGRGPASVSAREQADLENALSEAGSSPLEYLRAIEKHLQKYPDSPRKAELERAAARAAMEANDDPRIILYGERVLARQPDDLQFLERVTRVLLAAGTKEAAERAFKYALHSEQVIRSMRESSGRPRSGTSDFEEQIDRGVGRALTAAARASEILGRGEEALSYAQRSFDTFPSAESAREIARCFEVAGKKDDAIRAFADAFTIPDTKATDAERARDRSHMGELYRQLHGSESGLGELVLEAYDRNSALVHTRELRLRANDPNAELNDPMQFTVSGPGGTKLGLATLKGKVVVFDFWASWCVPCRAQHPLYEQVKQRYRDNPAVVFLSIDTDEDRDAVPPFLADVRWPDAVYFEDGLSRVLAITTIPTTVITDRQGRIFSRMNGFSPTRFVETLTGRIRDALAN